LKNRIKFPNGNTVAIVFIWNRTDMPHSSIGNYQSLRMKLSAIEPVIEYMLR